MGKALTCKLRPTVCRYPATKNSGVKISATAAFAVSVATLTAPVVTGGSVCVVIKNAHTEIQNEDATQAPRKPFIARDPPAPRTGWRG